MISVPLSRGQVAIIDDVDADRISGFHWHATRGQRTWYARATVGGEAVYMHRVLLDAPAGLEVDHKNGNGLDNRRANIRLCTHAQNQKNLARTSRSPYRFMGVWYEERLRWKRWRAYVRIDGRTKILGRFDTEEDAARARDAAAIKHYGPFARLNFPAQAAEVAQG